MEANLRYVFLINCFLFLIVKGRKEITYIKENKYPFMVSIQLSGKGHRCAGILLDGYRILTAASCFFDDNQTKKYIAGKGIQVVAGTLYQKSKKGPSAVVLLVKFVVIHPLFYSDEKYNLAQVYLKKQLHSNGLEIAYANIPKTKATDCPRRSKLCEVVGWGLTKNKHTVHDGLRKLPVYVGFCSEAILMPVGPIKGVIHNVDVGNPFIYKGMIYATVSMPSTPGLPAVFTELAKHLPFINSVRNCSEDSSEIAEPIPEFEKLHLIIVFIIISFLMFLLFLWN